MARSPNREKDVWFLGAGFSKAFGLPNTAELLSELHALSEQSPHWGVSQDLPGRLKHAYDYFYPDEGENFRPPVGDFFTVLSTYQDVGGSRLPQGFADGDLIVDMKFALAQVLCSRVKDVNDRLSESEDLNEIIQPGNIVITSNWDYLIERACLSRGVPYRLRWKDNTSSWLTLLKLHGSVDWTRRKPAKRSWAKSNYYRLKDLVGGDTNRRGRLSGEDVARCHAVENWTSTTALILRANPVGSGS